MTPRCLPGISGWHCAVFKTWRPSWAFHSPIYQSNIISNIFEAYHPITQSPNHPIIIYQIYHSSSNLSQNTRCPFDGAADMVQLQSKLEALPASHGKVRLLGYCRNNDEENIKSKEKRVTSQTYRRCLPVISLVFVVCGCLRRLATTHSGRIASLSLLLREIQWLELALADVRQHLTLFLTFLWSMFELLHMCCIGVAIS